VHAKATRNLNKLYLTLNYRLKLYLAILDLLFKYTRTDKNTTISRAKLKTRNYTILTIDILIIDSSKDYYKNAAFAQSYLTAL